MNTGAGQARTVRRMTAADIPAVAELENLCFAEPWSENALKLLTDETEAGTDTPPAALGTVLTENGAVIAYGGMLFATGEGQITNIAVHPEHRRTGAGRAILNALLHYAAKNAAESVFLEVRASNRPAIALYESAGFRQVGIRKHFYRFPTEGAVVMQCEISGVG